MLDEVCSLTSSEITPSLVSDIAPWLAPQSVAAWMAFDVTSVIKPVVVIVAIL